MDLKRMENGGIVVADVDIASAFFLDFIAAHRSQ